MADHIGYLLKSNITNDLGNIDGVINEPFETTQQTDFGLSIGLGKT
jgi:hypothetical protein